jgi:hypothetical protein
MKADYLNVILHNMARKPAAWRLDDLHALHRSGVTLWIGNGLFGYHLEKPEYQEIGFLEKFKLHQQIKLLHENKKNGN